jgi:sialate O-acetylesterase
MLSCIANGQLKLSSIFSNDMVLQQNQSVSVWGVGTPGKTVKVTPSWSNKEYLAKVENNGKWESAN